MEKMEQERVSKLTFKKGINKGINKEDKISFNSNPWQLENIKEGNK